MENNSPAPSARERILLTAHGLFYGEGIRATGIDRIIREAGVTKVTFYRHFPSKNDLIRAYLEYRHTLWMNWFKGALTRHGGPQQAPNEVIVGALGEWFGNENYRGCAFINAVVEFDGTLPEVAEISRRHKKEMSEVLAAQLISGNSAGKAEAIAMAIDGAIIRAQMGGSAESALLTLKQILAAISPPEHRESSPS